MDTKSARKAALSDEMWATPTSFFLRELDAFTG